MGSVAEDDDSERDGIRPHVDLVLDFARVPFSESRETIGDDEQVDDQVHDGVAEAETRDEAQRTNEGARDEDHARDHGPGAVVERQLGKTADEQVAAQDEIENACHE